MLDDRVPAAFIVDQVSIAWGIDNVQSELDAVLHDDWAWDQPVARLKESTARTVACGLNLCRLPHVLVHLQPAFGIDEV
jgi:hypothetical protein